jgi:hypothetical protein
MPLLFLFSDTHVVEQGKEVERLKSINDCDILVV